MGEGDKSKIYKDQLLVEYPTSEYAQNIFAERGEEFFDPILEIFKNAESAKDENIDESIKLYLSITHEYPESEYSPAALMAIGDIYDNLLGNLDSSITSYEKLINNYPDSPQTLFVKKRYNQLLAYKESLVDTNTVSDSTFIDSLEIETALPDSIQLDLRIPPDPENFEAVKVDDN
jgi:tetratricopeptide (TPR) repeat protein